MERDKDGLLSSLPIRSIPLNGFVKAAYDVHGGVCDPKESAVKERANQYPLQVRCSIETDAGPKQSHIK